MRTPAMLQTSAIGLRFAKAVIIAILWSTGMLSLGGPAAAQTGTGSGAMAAANLRVTLASEVPRPGVVSTRGPAAIQLSVQSGQLVRLARQSGRDYQLRASGGFYWTQVQELPANAESVAITPTLADDGSIEVSLEVARKRGTALQRYSSTLNALPGEWLQLFGPATAQSRGTTVYSTQQSSEDNLYLKVEY